jgi:nitrous oxide reductase accessory protein NosL
MKKLTLIAISALFALALIGPASVRADDTNKPAPKPYLLKTCAVCGMTLGEMGKPVSFIYKDREIKVCDKTEEKEFLKDPDKYLKDIVAQEAKLKK